MTGWSPEEAVLPRQVTVTLSPASEGVRPKPARGEKKTEDEATEARAPGCDWCVIHQRRMHGCGDADRSQRLGHVPIDAQHLQSGVKLLQRRQNHLVQHSVPTM